MRARAHARHSCEPPRSRMIVPRTPRDAQAGPLRRSLRRWRSMASLGFLGSSGSFLNPPGFDTVGSAPPPVLGASAPPFLGARGAADDGCGRVSLDRSGCGMAICPPRWMVNGGTYTDDG